MADNNAIDARDVLTERVEALLLLLGKTWRMKPGETNVKSFELDPSTSPKVLGYYGLVLDEQTYFTAAKTKDMLIPTYIKHLLTSMVEKSAMPMDCWSDISTIAELKLLCGRMRASTAAVELEAIAAESEQKQTALKQFREAIKAAITPVKKYVDKCAMVVRKEAEERALVADQDEKNALEVRARELKRKVEKRTEVVALMLGWEAAGGNKVYVSVCFCFSFVNLPPVLDLFVLWRILFQIHTGRAWS